MNIGNLRSGKEHIENRGRQKNYSMFLRDIYWKEDREIKCIALITPSSEWATVLLHDWVSVGPNKWRRFVCQRDPIINGADGDCILCELNQVDSRKFPRAILRHMALAFELEADEEISGGRRRLVNLRPIIDEVEKDGEVKRYPRIGVLVQAASNFWDELLVYEERYGDSTDVAFEVERRGKDTKTRYIFFPHKRPDLSEYSDRIPSLEDYISSLADEQRYVTELAEFIPSLSSNGAAEVESSKNVKKTESKTRFEELKKQLEQEYPQVVKK